MQDWEWIWRIWNAYARPCRKTGRRLHCASAPHADPVPRLAARFAAKEAVAKALGTGIGAKCAFTDVEVVRNDAGAPSILLHGAAGVTARELGITGWLLTMTHSGLSAAAAVIALAQ